MATPTSPRHVRGARAGVRGRAAEASPFFQAAVEQNPQMQHAHVALAKLQEWSDASGKSKVMARYVEHDPDLKWVKLEAVRDRDGPDTAYRRGRRVTLRGLPGRHRLYKVVWDGA